MEGVSYNTAAEYVEIAAGKVFDADPRVQAIGVGRHKEGGFGFRVIRNAQKILPSSATILPLNQFEGVPISYVDAHHDVQSLIKLPFQGPGSPNGFIDEQLRHRHIVCGLQIQNVDHDRRNGNLQHGWITVGTLGCFVKSYNGELCLLSNNHVIAGENSGHKGRDRIVQPSSATHNTNHDVAVLHNFVDLQFSRHNATPSGGNVVWNEVDAAVAILQDGVLHQQAYLPFRALSFPNTMATPQIGDHVFKVGRTTGLTYGEITDIQTIVGPIQYDGGLSWFRRSFTIQGLNGTQFSDQGDSGAAIVNGSCALVGILYAGNGLQTFACPIDLVLQDLQCSLAP